MRCATGKHFDPQSQMLNMAEITFASIKVVRRGRLEGLCGNQYDISREWERSSTEGPGHRLFKIQRLGVDKHRNRFPTEVKDSESFIGSGVFQVLKYGADLEGALRIGELPLMADLDAILRWCISRVGRQRGCCRTKQRSDRQLPDSQTRRMLRQQGRSLLGLYVGASDASHRRAGQCDRAGLVRYA